MKKMIMALVACLGIAACAAVDADAQQITFSSCTATLASAVSTTTQTGWLVANTKPAAKVAYIDVSWIVDSSTATLVFYENLRGTAYREVYRLFVPSSTITGLNTFSKNFNFSLPLTADYGLMVVQEAGSKAAGAVSVSVGWW